MKLHRPCKECLYKNQLAISQDPEYTKEIRQILDENEDKVSPPHMLYYLNEAYVRRFGELPDRYADLKKEFNDLLLSVESDLEKEIEQSEDPLKTALFMSRAGNYIDAVGVGNITDDVLMFLLSHLNISESDEKTYDTFIKDCESGKTFLLLADNCGEVVIDKLMLRQLKKRFPHLKIYVMVRDSNVLNDVTPIEAHYVGIDKEGEILTNGVPVAGAEYCLLPEESRKIFDSADVILSKGQGNYEALDDCGHPIFYLLLCKCPFFVEHFQVEPLTGIFEKV